MGIAWIIGATIAFHLLWAWLWVYVVSRYDLEEDCKVFAFFPFATILGPAFLFTVLIQKFTETAEKAGEGARKKAKAKNMTEDEIVARAKEILERRSS